MARSTSSLIIPFLAWPLAAAGCRPNAAAPAPTSTPAGAVGLIADLIPVPPARSAPLLESFRSELVRDSLASIHVGTLAESRSRFRAALLKSLGLADGIPRYQQEPLLRRLVSGGPEECGGASCAAAFGFTEQDVPNFLEDLRRDVSARPELQHPSHVSLRKALLGSLRPSTDPDLSPFGRLRRVIFSSATSQVIKTAAAGAEAAVARGHLSINLRPLDLLRATHVACFGKICETTIVKPVTIKLDVPIDLNTRIKVTYEQSRDVGGGLISQQLHVGLDTKPIVIEKILSVEVAIEADLEKSHATGDRLVVKDVHCSARVNCETPLFTIDAQVDRKGMEFSARLKSPQLAVGSLLKAEPAGPRVATAVPFSELPRDIRQVRDELSKLDLHPVNPDVFWDDFLTN